MLPILITLLLVTPILAIGSWIYLRRRKLTPRTRIMLMTALFLFVLISGPIIFLVWHQGGIITEVRSAGRAGRGLVGQLLLLWLLAVIGVGSQWLRLCRRKGEL